jgi:hypothetical protein
LLDFLWIMMIKTHLKMNLMRLTLLRFNLTVKRIWLTLKTVNLYSLIYQAQLRSKSKSLAQMKILILTFMWRHLIQMLVKKDLSGKDLNNKIKERELTIQK